MPQHKIVEKYFFFGLLLLVIVFSVFIFKPFLAIIALSGALAVVFYPLFLWINKYISHGIRWLSALLTVLVFMIVLCGPMFFIGSAVFTQSQDLYQSISSETNPNTLFLDIGNYINNYLPDSMALDVQESLKDATAFIASHLAQIFTTTLSAILGFLLVLLSMFYFLKDAQVWHRILVQLSPLSDKDDENILTKLERAINGVIKGYLLIGLVQGILVGIGFAIFGIPNPALFGVLAGIASLIPSIGTALVCVPAILYLWATGDTGNAIALAVWCGALVGTVDNILNPIVVGKNINLPAILILFSVLGGIALMGPIGILIGPLTLSLLYALISIYRGRSVV